MSPFGSVLVENLSWNRILYSFGGGFAIRSLSDSKVRQTPRALKFQTGISRPGHGGARKPATVFTEQGVAMLASVLRSPRAVAVSVAIIRAFVQLRELLSTHHELAAKVAELERKLASHDGAIRELFAAIRQLLAPPEPMTHREIGFHTRLALPKKGPSKGLSRRIERRPSHSNRFKQVSKIRLLTPGQPMRGPG